MDCTAVLEGRKILDQLGMMRKILSNDGKSHTVQSPVKQHLCGDWPRDLLNLP